MLLFDTSAIIELIKGNSKLEKYLDEQVVVSTITIHELHYGASNSKNFEQNMHTVRQVLENVWSIEVKNNIAIVAAQIRSKLSKKGKEKALADILIAATAVDGELELITFDKDFEEIAKNSELKVKIL